MSLSCSLHRDRVLAFRRSCWSRSASPSKRTIRFLAGEHKGEAYRRLNPKGKVPTLLIDDQPLTENVAIVQHLHSRFPDAGILPITSDPMEIARQTADLCFCSSTLHPIVARIRLLALFANPDAAPIVRARANDAMDEYFRLIEDRLVGASWWYGDQWSAMDAYLYLFWRVEGAGFDVARHPAFTRHARAMEQRPAVIRALEREAAATRQLEAEGMAFTSPS